MDLSIGKSRWLRVSTVLAATAVLVSACGTSPTGGGETPKNGGTLIWALDADAQSLNPFIAGDLPSVRAYAPLFPNLYSADKNLNIVPELADGMPTISSDKKEWTVKLKKAKWSDGSPITAKDVVTTAKIETNPDLDTDAGFDWGPLDKVEAVNDSTVKFTLKQPFAPFLANSLVGSIAPDSVYGKLDVKTMRKDKVNDTPTVTGGPFKFVKRVPGAEIDYEANPDYVGGRPHYDKMVAKVITDATAATQALINSEVQWHPSLGEAGPGAVTKARGSSNVGVHTYADLGYIDFRMNQRPGHLFSDKLVRQALAYALDKDSIVQAATEGNGQPLYGDIVPASWAYDAGAVVKYKQDVNKAKSLMQQAGWTIGSDGIATKGGKKFVAKIRVRAGKSQRIKAAEIIADQLKAIGMSLTPDPVDFKIFYKPIMKADYECFIAGFSLTIDPDEYTVIHSSQLQPEHAQGQNWTGYSNPELDRLIDEERATLKDTDAATKAARKPIFNQIQKILGEDVVTYYLWADKSSMGWTTGVGGIEPGNGDNTIYYDSNKNEMHYTTWWSKNAK